MYLESSGLEYEGRDLEDRTHEMPAGDSGQLLSGEINKFELV